MTSPRGDGPENNGAAYDEAQLRKDYLRFGASDEAALKALGSFSSTHVDGIIEEFYAHTLAVPLFREILSDQATIDRVKTAQRKYFLELTEGDYGPAYVEGRRRIGSTHYRVGLRPEHYMAAYCFYLVATLEKLAETPQQSVPKLTESLSSLLKAIFFDMTLAIEAYFKPTEELVVQQREAILELSTPVISLWEGIIMAPLIGTMDTNRANQVMERLLEGIVESQARVAILDVTGLPIVDTMVAAHLFDMVQAAKMLGSTVVITGISPAIAQTLTKLQIDLSQVITKGTLRAGLEEAFRICHVNVEGTQRTTNRVNVVEEQS